ncbi:hypothetical protein [Ornithinimicrobium sp. Y1694]|uniref:hypothetical protein n=1 Tax=Ornithinimicrobium sp. Y1694 TaxID=3418590 RepID=UPI003CF07AAC
MQTRLWRALTTLIAILGLLLTNAAAGTGAPADSADSTATTPDASPPGTFTGTVVRIVTDDVEGSQTHQDVRIVSGDASVAVPDALATDLEGGEQVRATIAGAATLTTEQAFDRADTGDLTLTDIQILASPAPVSQLGAHRVLIAPIYIGATPPSTPTTTQFRRLIADTSTYLSTTTNGQISLVEHQVRPWLKVNATDCNSLYTQVFGQTLPAQVAGTLAKGEANHIVFYTPDIGCPFAGMATVNVGAAGWPVVWLHADATVSTHAHELGHNMGLGHSGALECTNSAGQVVVGLSATCTNRTYEDVYDMMSAPMTDISTGIPGELAAYHQRRLGTMTSAAVPRVGAGTHTLRPLSSSTGVRGLEVPITSTRTLHLEYRTPHRADSWITSFANEDPTRPPGPGAGVIVRLTDSAADRRPDRELSTVDLQAADEVYTYPASSDSYYRLTSDLSWVTSR